MDGTRVRHAAKLYRPALENRAYLELARLLADPVLRGPGTKDLSVIATSRHIPDGFL